VYLIASAACACCTRRRRRSRRSLFQESSFFLQLQVQLLLLPAAYVSIRQHTPYVSIRLIACMQLLVLPEIFGELVGHL